MHFTSELPYQRTPGVTAGSCCCCGRGLAEAGTADAARTKRLAVRKEVRMSTMLIGRLRNWEAGAMKEMKARCKPHTPLQQPLTFGDRPCFGSATAHDASSVRRCTLSSARKRR